MIKIGTQLRNVQHNMLWKVEEIFAEQNQLEGGWDVKCYMSNPEHQHPELMWMSKLTQLLDSGVLELVS